MFNRKYIQEVIDSDTIALSHADYKDRLNRCLHEISRLESIIHRAKIRHHHIKEELHQATEILKEHE